MCLYKRLIRQRKFVSSPIFTFPKKFELSTKINTLSAQLNSDWEIDFLPALRIKHDACIFVTPHDKVKFQEVCKSSIFTNMLLFSNLRTGYVHFQLLPSRKYRDIRMCLQSFLHMYAIHKLKLHCDSESAFLKGESLSGGKKGKYTDFLDSREAKELQESYDITFSCHRGFHSYLTGHIESRVKIFKRSFSSFNSSFTSTELNCVLSSIARIINARPLGLFRQQQPHNNELSIVTPHNLMFNTLSPRELEKVNTLSESERKLDIGSMMNKIQKHVTKILSKYLDIILYTFRPLHNQRTGFNASLLKHGCPVLFRYRSTGVSYKGTLFHLGLIDSPKRDPLRNSRCIFVRAVCRGKVKKISILREDIVPLAYERNDLEISDHDLISLGLK